MKALRSSKKGFVTLPIIIIAVAIVATVAGVGAYVYVVNQDKSQIDKPDGRSNESSESSDEGSLGVGDTGDDSGVEMGLNQNVGEGNEYAPSEVTATEVPVTSTVTPTVAPTVTRTMTPTQAQATASPNPVTSYVDYPRQGSFIYIDSELNLTASVVNGGVQLNWTRCNSDQFVAYKVSRSETASDVYFPRDGSIFSTPNQNSLSYVDRNVVPGKTYYYRICSLERNGESWCGNAVAVTYR